MKTTYLAFLISEAGRNLSLPLPSRTFGRFALAGLMAACLAPAFPAAGQAEKPQPAAPAAIVSSSGVATKLLDAGASPRKALRLHPKEGDKRTATMIMKMGMDMDMGGGGSQSMKMPPMKMVMEAEVKKATTDGDISFESTITDATVTEDPDAMPQMVEAMKASIGGVKGAHVVSTMSSRGINKQTEVKGISDMAPQVKQQVEQMKSAFANTGIGLPEEAVGIGAKWEVKQQVDSQGMKLEQTTLYELVAMDGDKVTAKTTLKQFAEHQKVNNPAMPNMKVEVRRLTSEGSGETTIDLRQILPVKSVINMKNDTEMSMDMGGQNMDMSMKMEMNVTVETK